MTHIINRVFWYYTKKQYADYGDMSIIVSTPEPYMVYHDIPKEDLEEVFNRFSLVTPEFDDLETQGVWDWATTIGASVLYRTSNVAAVAMGIAGALTTVVGVGSAVSNLYHAYQKGVLENPLRSFRTALDSFVRAKRYFYVICGGIAALGIGYCLWKYAGGFFCKKSFEYELSTFINTGSVAKGVSCIDDNGAPITMTPEEAKNWRETLPISMTLNTGALGLPVPKQSKNVVVDQDENGLLTFSWADGTKVAVEPVNTTQGVQSGDVQTKKNATFRNITIVKGAPTPSTLVTQGGGVDPNGLETLEKKLVNNLAELTVLHVDDKEKRLDLGTQNGLFVRGNQLITTSHIVSTTCDPTKVLLRVKTNTATHEYLWSTLWKEKWNDADIITIVLPSWSLPMPDITKHFIETERCDTDFREVLFVRKKYGGVRYDPVFPPKGTNKYTAIHDDGVSMVTLNGFQCQTLETEKGDCGGFYYALDKRINHKILGMHNAWGAKDGAFGCWISKERLMKHLPPLGGVVVPKFPIVTQCALEKYPFSEEILARLDFIGTQEPPQIVPVDSKIGPSLIQQNDLDVLKPLLTKPAALGKFKKEVEIGEVKEVHWINPYDIALGKWARKVHPLRKTYSQCLSAVLGTLPNVIGKPDNEFENVVSDDMAVNGKLGSTQEPIEVKTGPGRPYVYLPHNQTGKRSWLPKDSPDGAPNHYHMHELVYENLMRRLRAARKGKSIFTLWGDCLKDERRPLEKVSSGSTRLFCVGPLDFTIACRKYFMRFSDHCIKNHNTLFTKIGINPDGQDWKLFYSRLNRWGRRRVAKLLAGDFSNYDMSLPPWLTLGVINAILKWFELCGSTPEENQIRRVLMEDILHSTRIHGRYVYRCPQGVPSGHFLTALFNSIVNYVIFKTCVFAAFLDKEGRIMSDLEFDNFYECGMVGDDHVCGQNPEVDWFSQRIYQKYVKEIFGMDYTDSKKSAQISDFTEWEDLVFLQRYFHEDSIGRVFGPLKREILDEEISWIRHNMTDSPKVSTWKNMDASLRGYMHWGRELFEQKKTLYNDIAFKLGIPPFNLEFDDLIKQWERR